MDVTGESGRNELARGVFRSRAALAPPIKEKTMRLGMIKAGLLAAVSLTLVGSVSAQAQDGMRHRMMRREMHHRMMRHEMRHEMHHRMMHRMMRRHGY